MLVKMKIHIGGYTNGQEWPQAGDTIDLPDVEAAQLIAVGYAVDPNAEESDEPVAAPAPDDAAASEPDGGPGTGSDAADPAEPGEPERPKRTRTTGNRTRRSAAKPAAS